MTQAAIFRERLWPGWGAAGAALGMAASLAIAYAAAYGHAIGWLTFACSCAAMTVIAIPASPVTTVTTAALSVGRAKIEKGFLGQAGVISPARLRQLRRDRSLHNAFWAVPIGSRTAVAVAINDDEDPHPMWIIGSRRPDDLLNALRKLAE
ncbi:MAG: hypothetical protein RL745_446 [Actinomycetota bacterium]